MLARASRRQRSAAFESAATDRRDACPTRQFERTGQGRKPRPAFRPIAPGKIAQSFAPLGLDIFRELFCARRERLRTSCQYNSQSSYHFAGVLFGLGVVAGLETVSTGFKGCTVRPTTPCFWVGPGELTSAGNDLMLSFCWLFWGIVQTPLGGHFPAAKRRYVVEMNRHVGLTKCKDLSSNCPTLS